MKEERIGCSSNSQNMSTFVYAKRMAVKMMSWRGAIHIRDPGL